ncbi:TIGR01777 family oxidoreductase [bacterium]|nr:TIGR01777 family oxidoreductase [candidate division CSSED10-310 bacterium]
MKRVVIAGGTGFIGSALVDGFLETGYKVQILTRRHATSGNSNASVDRIIWDGQSRGGWIESINGADIIVNVSGKNLVKGIWTKSYKKKLYDSRVKLTELLVRTIGTLKNPPKLFIQASAIGYYGDCGDIMLNESSPPGKGFLAKLTEDWENSLRDFCSQNTRFIITRFGIVLGNSGGVIPDLKRFFKLFLGIQPGRKRAWFSWIHIDDLVRGMMFLAENPTCQGIYNFTAPEPIQKEVFYRILAQRLSRPLWFAMPDSIISMIAGDMGKETLLFSQRVVPQKLMDEGFIFRYKTISEALDVLI